jgi:hypothetical protein
MREGERERRRDKPIGRMVLIFSSKEKTFLLLRTNPALLKSSLLPVHHRPAFSPTSHSRVSPAQSNSRLSVSTMSELVTLLG